MASKGYTTKGNIENYLVQTIDENFAGQIDAWISAVERYIDNLTGRNFKADAQDQDRVFDGNGQPTMTVDDFISITEIKIDGVAVTNGQWLLYPANKTPKNKITLKSDYFSPGQQNITIKGKWGYSANVPEDITLAATILVAGIINYGNDSKGKIRSESVGSYSVTYKDEKSWQDFERVEAILDSYKQYNSF